MRVEMKNVIFSTNIEYIKIDSLFIKIKIEIFKNLYVFNY